MEITEILVLTLLLLGAVLHGVTGLGFPMISTMSVAILFPLPVAVALVILPNIVINLMVLMPSKATTTKGVRYCVNKYQWLMLASFVGCVIGVLLLKKLPLFWLYIFLSVATLFYVFYTLFGQRNQVITFQAKNERGDKKRMIFFGLLAGIVGGATNAMSSILMMYLLASSNDKNEIIKTSNICFLLAKIVQIFLLKDEILQLGQQVLGAVMLVTLLSIIALFLGINLRNRLSITLFKRFVLLMLFLLSLRALWRAFSLMV